MSRRLAASASATRPGATSAPLSRARHRLFLALTLAVPVVFLVGVELVLRVAWAGGRSPAFDPVTLGGVPYLAPGRTVARRYFTGEATPPEPPVDLFAANKPAHALRIFVLGESTAAGFPYPRNGTFSRVLRDALGDVLPGDTVEVVNMGIAATNSYTMVDLAREVIAQKPDAVLIYAGHNEYYGALGVGSTIRAGASPALIRLYLSAGHLRTVALLRTAIAAATRAIRPERPDSLAATFMESVARDQEILFQSPEYEAGLRQFGDNLGVLLRRFRDARVPVFIGSVASNVRDQRPFVSRANGAARAAFDSASAALALGDSALARRLFLRARDLDVVRFRAPTALNGEIERAASALGARYVPVAERLEAASLARSPGRELFLEHVHPNRHGYLLIAEAFFDALRAQGFLGRRARLDRLDSWPSYETRMALTPFDERIAEHTVRTVTTRWPFVDRADALDYRGSYRPASLADSLALLVSRGGMPWLEAKLRVAADAEARHHADSALAEYRGVIRDRPLAELPYRLAGRALLAQGRLDEATAMLERALALAPSWETYHLLGVVALQQKRYERAIALLDRAVESAPGAVAPLYQLSLAFGLSQHLGPARAAAKRAAALDPGYPGLADWMRTLGMRSP